ncbi:DUF4157 domain-containing protein [Blastomonas sp. AAP53]|uniref:DUF4157 domain-containing protein n=1 Tax=Blastomonas sp. AAP53 TaxID=1248760 RepID=UPI0002EE0EBD|nr:DUF4157 domain-containing protein [Blastomonas sp. AAP53]
MSRPRNLTKALLVLAILATGGCIERPDEELLRPPPEIAKALGRLGSQTVQSSRQLATQARNGSEQLVRRSSRLTGPVLAQAIRHAEAQASRAGPRPVPEDMARILRPYFAPDLLASVRWTIGTGRVDLGTLLTEQYMEEGAVALNRQVVFSSERLTGNVWIWAHELAHVEQYRRMGINRFAAAYIADWRAIEREATNRANAVTAAIRKAG